MSADTIVLDRESSVSTPANPTSVPVEKVLDGIRRDSREDVTSYLEETEAPHGGE